MNLLANNKEKIEMFCLAIFVFEKTFKTNLNPIYSNLFLSVDI